MARSRKVSVHVIESAQGHFDEYPDGRIELWPGDTAPAWLELGDHCFEKQDEEEEPVAEGAGVETGHEVEAANKQAEAEAKAAAKSSK